MLNSGMKQINYAPEIAGNGGEVNTKVVDAVGGTAQIAGEIVQESPKMKAWKEWLHEKGYALGRKDDDIEINGDIVTVKIPGYKDLVFNPNDYKIGNQNWISNDNAGKKQGSGNKFSKVDFEKLIEFLGGNNLKGYWREAWASSIFIIDVLGLRKGNFYWFLINFDDMTQLV